MTTEIKAKHPHRHALANQQKLDATHRHGLGDIAGYVVVATDWSTGKVISTDVAEFVGAGTYGEAIELCDLYRSKAVTNEFARVDTVYLDGCRIL